MASSLGDFKMAKFLLSHDYIHVDEEDSEGMTPILRYNKQGAVLTDSHASLPQLLFKNSCLIILAVWDMVLKGIGTRTS